MAENPSNSPFLERKIVTGLIISTDYINRIQGIFDPVFLKSIEAKKISQWCFTYFEQYQKAPKQEIQAIYMSKINKLQKAEAEIIETILDGLSDEYDRKKFNVDYLIDETEKYFKKQKLLIDIEQVQEELENGNLLEAEKLILDFNPVQQIQSNAVTPLATMEQCKQAHEGIANPLISYGDTALGEVLNEAMVRSSLIGILGQNKGGKSFLLMDLALRGASQGSKVVFFQAGDMTQQQMERRQAIYYSMRSDLKKYCGLLFIPTLDCVHNQDGSCDKDQREGGDDRPFPFAGRAAKDIRCETDCKLPILHKELIKAYYKFPDHKPCYNCLRSGKAWDFMGTIWVKRRDRVEPITWKDTYKVGQKRKHILNNIRLITYPNEGLTMQKANAELDLLEKEGFIADIDIFDYADIMEPDKDTLKANTRDQENKKWQRARRLSQERKQLVIMGSQSDTQGFDAPLLTRKNFNEDRRKLDHMTALFGLNMLPREKERGILRINDILNREGEGNKIVNVMHRLQIGRPILGSFF